MSIVTHSALLDRYSLLEIFQLERFSNKQTDLTMEHSSRSSLFSRPTFFLSLNRLQITMHSYLSTIHWTPSRASWSRARRRVSETSRMAPRSVEQTASSHEGPYRPASASSDADLSRVYSLSLSLSLIHCLYYSHSPRRSLSLPSSLSVFSSPPAVHYAPRFRCSRPCTDPPV